MLQEQSGITPPALDRKPELDKYQRWLFEEFRKLSRDRGYTEAGPMALTTGIIRTHYDAFKLHDFDFDDFHLRMTTIDDGWLEQVTLKRKKELDSSKSKAKSPASKPGRR